MIKFSHGLRPFALFPDSSLSLVQLCGRWLWSRWDHKEGDRQRSSVTFVHAKRLVEPEVNYEMMIPKNFYHW